MVFAISDCNVCEQSLGYKGNISVSVVIDHVKKQALNLNYVSRIISPVLFHSVHCVQIWTSY